MPRIWKKIKSKALDKYARFRRKSRAADDIPLVEMDDPTAVEPFNIGSSMPASDTGSFSGSHSDSITFNDVASVEIASSSSHNTTDDNPFNNVAPINGVRNHSIWSSISDVSRVPKVVHNGTTWVKNKISGVDPIQLKTFAPLGVIIVFALIYTIFHMIGVV